MNLRINLIADSERRSASFVTPKFFFSLMGSLIAAALACFIAVSYWNAKHVTAKLTSEQWAWERSRDGFNKSQSLAARQKAAVIFMKDIAKWRDACGGWSERLTELAPAIPVTIQLTELRLVRETSGAPDAPKVSAELRLSGRTESPSAATDVAVLRDAFSATALSNGVMKAVIPPDAFRQDPAQQASAEARIFEIVCTYREEAL